jgi:hypothetical protein
LGEVKVVVKSAEFPSLNVDIIAQHAEYVLKKWTIIVFGLTGVLDIVIIRLFYSL